MKVLTVQQSLKRSCLSNVPEAVRRQLDGLQLNIPQGPVAITAGSRGITDIISIIRTAGAWLREKGAQPFLVPCMGSHNGATAEGQRDMLLSLGLTPEQTGLEIRSSMEVVQLAQTPTGAVWMDRQCYEADGVLVINRVKKHTAFTGPLQSGLTKMMVVGMGKIKSAETFHRAPTRQMATHLKHMGQVVVDSGKILAGLAILEDGYDQTAELHAIRPEDILSREPDLVKRHLAYFPTLPLDQLNVLVVGELGKNYSGVGMDPNVTARSGISDLQIPKPEIHIIAALRLAAASHGNATGVGLADFISQPLRDAIDEHKTLINVLTSGEMSRARIPATCPNDKELIDTMARRFGSERWMFISNTLHLEHLYVSEDLLPELREHPHCHIDPTPLTLQFTDHQLSYPKLF